MPRSGGGRSGGGGRAPSRPSAPAPPSRAPQQQQQRGMTTTAQPPARAQAPAAPAAQQSPGLFGQMASTAAGVAVGSSIGHALGGFFGGGSSSTPEAAAPAQSYDNQSYQQNSTDAYAQPMDTGLYNSQSSSYGQQAASGPCAADTAKFTQCFDKTGGDMSACGYYLEQLKACQQAARNFAQ